MSLNMGALPEAWMPVIPLSRPGNQELTIVHILGNLLDARTGRAGTLRARATTTRDTRSSFILGRSEIARPLSHVSMREIDGPAETATRQL
jgi:hypothetical protein